jgi:tetratricopeptide (TPR) repeat protein
LAAYSSTVSAIFGEDGVGLSGVVYGLFGFLLVLSRKDERFRTAVDAQTTGLFIGWFFICILLTRTGALNVANIAHGAGVAVGALAGFAVGSIHPGILAGMSTLVFVCLLIVGALYRPQLNCFEPDRDYKMLAFQNARFGYVNQNQGDHKAAVGNYQNALRFDSQNAEYWYNLGISFQHLNRIEDAKDAYRHALALEPSNATYKSARDAVDTKGGK